jgi:flagellar hook-basal body complex protein FliE
MEGIVGLRILPAEVEFTRPRTTGVPDADGFSSVLKGAMEQVDTFQSQANQKVSELLAGGNEDVHSAMIAVEKADLSFQLMMQVRNKVVQAYQEVSRMQF